MSLFQGIIQGAPGSAKTGLLCSLADAGFHVIRCAFEPGLDVLRAYTTPEGFANIYNHLFEDDWEEADGLKRVARGMTAFEHFLFNGKVGSDQPYGSPRTWDDRTVLVYDTLTSMGELAESRALKLNSSTREGRHLWTAAQDQESACQVAMGRRRNHHMICLAHSRLISPKAESGYKDETELQKQVKRERAELEETGYFPTAVTPGIARNFVRHFPFSLLVEIDHNAKNGSQRVLRTTPVPGYQIKCPVTGIKDKLPVEQALLTIFKALGND